MISRRMMLASTAFTGGLLFAHAAYAGCTPTSPAPGDTVVCTGTTSLPQGAPILVGGDQITVQIGPDAVVENPIGGVVSLGAEGDVDNQGQLTSGNDSAVVMGDDAVFRNAGTVSAASSSAAVVVGAGAVSVRNESGASITNAGGGVSTGAGLQAFENFGEITSNGGVPGADAVFIGGVAEDAEVVNGGLISGDGADAAGLHVAGAAIVWNTGEIDTIGERGIALRTGADSKVVNRGTLLSVGLDSVGLVVGAGSTVTNTSFEIVTLVPGAPPQITGRRTGAELGAGSSLDNGGEITGGDYGVLFHGDGTLTNAVNGSIIADGLNASAAVLMAGGANTLTNAGVIDASIAGNTESRVVHIDTAAGLTSLLHNEETGVIGHDGFIPEIRAIDGTGAGALVVENYGSVFGAVHGSDAGTLRLYNGLDELGNFGGQAALIKGDVTLGAGADKIVNAGEIVGDITTGGGDDTVVFEDTGWTKLTGALDLGDGNDALTTAGTISGPVQLGLGADTMTVGPNSRLLDHVDLGGGVDVLILDDADATSLATGKAFHGGGDAGDKVVFRGSSGADAWRASQFVGFSDLVKDGAGQVDLTGDWTGISTVKISGGTLHLDTGGGLTGAATIEAGGVYRVDGLHDGDVTIAAGGELSGTGQIGWDFSGRDVTNAGLVQAGFGGSGSGFRPLLVTGDYTQTSTGVLSIRLGAAGENDSLEVLGVAHLDGTVRFVPLALAESASYEFLTAGSISGQFAHVTEINDNAGLFFNYAVTYANGVATVTVVKNGAPSPSHPWPPALSLTPNAQAVLQAFLSPGTFSVDLATVRADLNGIGFERAPDALASLAGEIHALTTAEAAGAGRLFQDAVARRQDGARRGGSTQAQQSLASNGRETTLWVDVLGGSGEVDAGHGTAAYNSRAAGVALGGDRALGAHGRAGLAFGMVRSDLDQDQLRSSASLTSYELGGYASFDLGRTFVDAQASYGRHALDTRRILTTGPTSLRQADGSTDADELRWAVKAGVTLGSDAFAVRPIAGLAYAKVDGAGLQETGAGDAGLVVRDNGYEALTGKLGVEVDGALGSARPFARIAVAYDLSQDGYRTTDRFIGGGDAFTAVGAEPGRTAVLADLGFTARLARRVDLTAAYGVALSEGEAAQSLSLGASLRW